MKSLFSFFLFAISFNGLAQNLNGEWYGNYEKQFLTLPPQKVVVEIQVTNDSIITGASHLYYRNNKYEHYLIRGKYKLKDSTIYFKEDSTISVKLGFMAGNCLGNYTMKLRETDSSYILEGKWKDNHGKGIFNCPTTRVYLEKKKNIVNKTTPSPFLNRTNEVQSIVEYKSAEGDSIRIDVYDNGEIDNDIISLYFNNEPVIQNLKISDKPKTFYLSLDPSLKFNKIYMVAESLGEIPPCTALLIVTTKLKRYEVNLSGNMSKNAALEFFLKE